MATQEHQVYPNVNMPFVSLSDGRVTPPWQRFLLSLWGRTGGGTVGSPGAGFVAAWAGENTPEGYLLCDGREVSRVTYEALFTAIGTVWGNGDGSETFNLPDLVDKFPRGAKAAGGTGGDDSVSISLEQMPSHTHVVTDPGHLHAVVDPGHKHTAMVAGAAGPPGAAGAVVGDTSTDVTGLTVATAVTGITIEPTGGSSDSGKVDIVPSYATVIYVIKT